MSSKFQYNFTNENQLVELRERINDLQEENALLKQSLEELIKVNTQLTQSIQEFNNDNLQAEYQSQQIQEMHNTIEVLNNENQKLRRENEANYADPSKNSRKADHSVVDDQQTESLVNVLQELIQSFKNMQGRYEQQIEDFNSNCGAYKKNLQLQMSRLQEGYKQKLNTLEPIILQLNRKDENLGYIQERLYELERRKTEVKQNGIGHNSRGSHPDMKMMEEALEQKNKIIKFYQGLILKLKAKFSQKI